MYYLETIRKLSTELLWVLDDLNQSHVLPTLSRAMDFDTCSPLCGPSRRAGRIGRARLGTATGRRTTRLDARISMRLNSSAPAKQGKGKGKGKGAGKGAGTAFKGTRRVSTQPRPSRLWQLCWAGMRARRGLDGSSGRWLVAYAHASNGARAGSERSGGLSARRWLSATHERIVPEFLLYHTTHICFV